MNFTNKFTFDWGSNDGTEPSTQLQQNGFAGGYKPPAGVFNWFWRKTIKCITEMQTAITTVESSVPDVIDNLTSEAATDALSANQGKSLKTSLDKKTGEVMISGTSVTVNTGSVSNNVNLTTTTTCGTGAEISNDYRERTFNALGECTAGNVASGDYSHAGGQCSTAKGNSSFAHGINAIAHYEASVAFGTNTQASHNQLVCGYNNKNTSPDFSGGGPALGNQAANYAIFAVGNGSDNTVSGRSNALRTFANGQTKGLAAFLASGADFAEYFEWIDENPQSEDRRGRIVTLDGEKIRPANSNDEYILGVVSGAGAFIGNSASENWQGKYLSDVFGEKIMQTVVIPETTDEATGEVVPEHTIQQFTLNPDFDANEEYIGRDFRKEWSPIGMLGQVIAVDDGTCTVGGYCSPSTNGIGTASESGFRVMKRIDSTHIKVLVK